MQPVMSVPELEAFLAAEFPQVNGDFGIDRLTPEGVIMRLKVEDRHLRPGGTVSGPSMFALADVAVYIAILSRIGPVALAVTTGASLDFLRKPEAGRDLVGEARLLKLGARLAVGDVLIRSESSQEAVARATMTYSVPPRR